MKLPSWFPRSAFWNPTFPNAGALCLVACLASTLPSTVLAAEPAAKSEPTVATAPTSTPAATPATPPAAAPKPDPTSAIVAVGRQVYRQRDLDALVLIAARHVKTRISNADEDQLRQALARILVAREPLVEALASLPPGLQSGKARDALLLDLIDYQAEIAKPAQPPAASGADGAKPATEVAAANANANANANAKSGGDAAKPGDAKDSKDEAKPADVAGPVIISLPPLQQTRTLDKLGKRQLSLQIALYFADAATARVFEPKAPLIRDAILGYVHELPAADFAEPDQVALKKGLVAAVTARVADFPADGILIPQLEVGAPDDKDK